MPGRLPHELLTFRSGHEALRCPQAHFHSSGRFRCKRTRFFKTKLGLETQNKVLSLPHACDAHCPLTHMRPGRVQLHQVPGDVFMVGGWAVRRLAASAYVLDYGGGPLPKSRDWATRSLEFIAPSPSLRVFSPGSSPVGGAIMPIPTITALETRPTSPKSRQKTPLGPPTELKSPVHADRTPTRTEDAPLNMNLEELMPPRVRMGRDTRTPVNPDSRRASKMDPATKETKLDSWMA